MGISICFYPSSHKATLDPRGLRIFRSKAHVSSASCTALPRRELMLQVKYQSREKWFVSSEREISGYSDCVEDISCLNGNVQIQDVSGSTL